MASFYPNNKRAHFFLFHFIVFAGRYKLAEVDLQQALELKPDFEDALLNLNQVRHDLQTGHQFNTTEN